MKCYLCGVRIGPDFTYKHSYIFNQNDYCPSCHGDLLRHKYSKRWIKKELKKYGRDEENEWSVIDLLRVNNYTAKVKGKVKDVG